MNDVINRKDAIGAILSVGHIAELSDGDAVIRVSAVNYVLGNLPSAQPDLDSAYTEGYTAAESKYRKMWDEMQATQPVPEDKWGLFEMISSAWYGKQCYFEQNDGTVYSRLTGRYLTFEDAVKEFMGELKNG